MTLFAPTIVDLLSPQARVTTIRLAGMRRPAKNCWSSAAITRPARCHWTTTLGVNPVLVQGPTGGRKPINAKCETVRTLPTFRDAYSTRRCIVPVDGFFEWKAIKGQKAKATLRDCDERRIAVRSCRTSPVSVGCVPLIRSRSPPSAPYTASSTPENFRHFAAKPHHANRKAEYQGQHDDPRARLPITEQCGLKSQRRDYG
jgi:hypothetical protein